MMLKNEGVGMTAWATAGKCRNEWIIGGDVVYCCVQTTRHKYR
jgi:hypothetical protein